MKNSTFVKVQTFPWIQLHPSISKKQIQDLSQFLQFDSHLLTLILYNYLQSPRLEQFLQVTLQGEGELCLMKKEIQTKNYKQDKQQNKDYEYLLLYMVNENTPLQMEGYHERPSSADSTKQLKQLKPILTALVSLCNKVVVFDLDNQKQAFIEKVFFQSITTCQKIQWQNPTRVQRLVFVRQCYAQQNLQNSSKGKSPPKISKSRHDMSNKLTVSTSMDTLQYYSSLQEYNQHLLEEKQRYLNLKRQFAMVNDNHFVDNLVLQKKVNKKISLKQILNIYENIMEMMTKPIEQIVVQSLLNKFTQMTSQGSEKNIKLNFQNKHEFGKVNLNEPWKVRYYLQKMYELDSMNNLYVTLQQEIFYPDTSVFSGQYVKKQLVKYLSSSPISKASQLLFTQTNSISHFDYIPVFMSQLSLPLNLRQKLQWKLHRLDKFQRQLIQQSKISPSNSSYKLLYELSEQQVTSWLQTYYQKWLSISLEHLKQYFDRIANQKDHKAMQQFKQECYKMQERINEIDCRFYSNQKQHFVQYLKMQLKQFVQYHYDVIEMKRFSGLKFFYKQVLYILKHKEKIRNKIILFILILTLALMQNDVIAGLTIGTMAIIVLAIRL